MTAVYIELLVNAQKAAEGKLKWYVKPTSQLLFQIYLNGN